MTTHNSSLPYGVVAKLVAKPETADEVAQFLTDAFSLADAEAGTVVWFAVRTDPTTFWVFDAFEDEGGRKAHLNGPIAQALMDNADRLLAEAPSILPADVLAAKVPGRVPA